MSSAKLELHRVDWSGWPILGDYITGYAGGVPVVVIRNDSGLAGFVNVCRHRRHEVMKGRGNAKVMQCGYHAWTYDLTGCLKGAPRSADRAEFPPRKLSAAAVEGRSAGSIRIRQSRSRRPRRCTAYFGPVLDIIAGSGIDLDTLELYSREDWQSHSNWKTMLENYLECYHCAVAHPSFSAAIDVRQENYNLTAHGWFSSQVGQVRPSALEGSSQVKIYDVARRGGAVAIPPLMAEHDDQHQSGLPQPVDRRVDTRTGRTRPRDSPSNISGRV